jgi:hypothetical protein
LHTNIINKHTKIYYPYYNNINKSIIFVEEMNNQNITINNEYYALQAGGHRFEPCISHHLKALQKCEAFLFYIGVNIV